METLASDLHKVPGNGWKHYFFEFFMLFLAVSLGFFVENLREHHLESEREERYMKNLYEDLKSDTVTYSNYAKGRLDFLNKIDSLIILMKKPDRDANLARIYFLARTATMTSSTIFPNERTFDQMESSGLLRLISNHQVADSVSYYYNSLKGITLQNEIIKDRLTGYMTTIGKLFDAEVLIKILKEGKEQARVPVKLLSEDPVLINDFLTNAQYFYGSCMLQKNWCLNRSGNAKNLIELIKKEYHFE